MPLNPVVIRSRKIINTARRAISRINHLRELEHILKNSSGYVAGFDKPTKTRFYIFRNDVLLFHENGKVERATGSLTQNKELDKTPDYCTMVPDFDIGDICKLHDEDYARGGDEADRKKADRLFRDRIRDRGRPIIAELYYHGVRIFGKKFFNYHDESPSHDPDRYENTRVIFTGDIIIGDTGNIA